MAEFIVVPSHNKPSQGHQSKTDHVQWFVENHGRFVPRVIVFRKVKVNTSIRMSLKEFSKNVTYVQESPQ